MGRRLTVALADLRAREGFVSKDTVVGGYGSRLKPFSRVTRVISYFKRQFHDVPSIHLGYTAALLSRAGHEVLWTRGRDQPHADVALVLSSLVDYRNETSWADRMRASGVGVGFMGIAASKLPELFAPHSDFIISGEPEAAVMRLAQTGDVPAGTIVSEPIEDLDMLPFPRWDLVTTDRRQQVGIQWSSRPVGGGYPLLASRGCPEFCTYCPHRILAGYRARTISSIVDEIEHLIEKQRRPYIVFRDPLFSVHGDRCIALCDEIRARRLRFTFEAETRLDRLDFDLLDRLHEAGLRAISFGVESVDPGILRKSGRRPTLEVHQRGIVEHCRRKGIVTAAFYVLGFIQDDWASIAATIDYATQLGSTFAQFKILTPYAGTPMFRQLRPLLIQDDWERFDGYTPTFAHPNLSSQELRYLSGAAYRRFYMRPSFLANLMAIEHRMVRDWVDRIDECVHERHCREEIATISRTVVAC
jgi:radical SAM superfamily enzyme YgiQ (UPF0313 family)